MSRKDELLSIGEMAKLSGAGVQALRYYERKDILHPVFIDPSSGYRYYSLDQLHHVIFIRNCVMLGVPLVEATRAFHSSDMDGAKDFIEQCKKTAERKIEILKRRPLVISLRCGERGTDTA